MFGWFKKKPEAKEQARSNVIRARYDAAQTTADNQRHWGEADSLSSKRANSPQVRMTLRNRARYEVANNCYARGIINSLASYTIGSGPTLALSYLGSDSESASTEIRAAAREVERKWADWFDARGIASKLHTLRIAMAQDGEGFGLLTSSPRFGMEIDLDLSLIEADQVEENTVAVEWGSIFSTAVRQDRSGNPVAYYVLEEHPGDMNLHQFRGNWIDARGVIHLFRRDRPGQVRGIPEITPALPMFAQLRRFALATLTAAETAADFAAILYNDAPGDDSSSPVAWERIEIERGAMITAPDGSRLAQLKAEHPNSTYDEFIKAQLREIARCLSIPAVVALGDASSYNYSSGRLDLQTFIKQMECDRSLIIEREALAKLWAAWLDEALLIDGFLPPIFVASLKDWRAGWRWQGLENVDRAKEASGQAQELASNTTTLQREYARRGEDWETALRQRARELALINELGLVSQAPQQPQSNQDPNQGSQADQLDPEEMASNGSN